MITDYRNLAGEYSDKGADYYQHSRQEMLRFVSSETKRVLDVGCGSGGFGRLLKSQRARIEVWGVEPGPEAAKVAAKSLDRVINAEFSAEIAELHGENFDCIVFNDVLEHTANPQDILEACKQFLSPDGTVVASIPNILHFPTIYSVLRTQDWRYQESGVLDKTHLRFFTRKSIITLFSGVGYDVLHIEGLVRYSHWKFNILNWFLLNHLNDFRYMQFAIVAKPNTERIQ